MNKKKNVLEQALGLLTTKAVKALLYFAEASD